MARQWSSKTILMAQMSCMALVCKETYGTSDTERELGQCDSQTRARRQSSR